VTRPPIKIRPYEDEDEAQVVALWATVFPGDPGRNEPAALIERKRRVQRDLFLVGEMEDRVVCAVMGGYDGFRGWVYHLAVAPAHRRKGLGATMMAAVEERLRALGCPKVNLQVRATNTEVVSFYRSLGYQAEERVSMGKVLT
jgi:ribosomal protein S18 acetylase RimI-like enzyme